MDKILNNFEYLNLLCCCNKKTCKSIINSGNKSLIFAICECILNCLNGNINLNAKDKDLLKNHKSTLRYLASKNKPLKKRKSLLAQKGSDILPIVLPAVLSFLASFINK